MLLLIAALWPLLEVYRAFASTPGPVADYGRQLTDLVERSQSAYASEPNAWPYLMDTLDRFDQALNAPMSFWTDEAGVDRVLDFRIFSGSDTGDSVEQLGEAPGVMRATADAAMGRIAASDVFERLAALCAMRHAIRPAPDGPLIDWELPELGRCRKITRVNVIRMQRAHAAGNDSEIVAPFEQSLALARLLAQQPTMMDHVAACSVAMRALREVREEIAERPPPPAVLKDLLAAMDRQLPLMPSSHAFEGERLLALDQVDRVHTASGRFIPSELAVLDSGRSLDLDEPAPSRWLNFGAGRLATKNETVRLVNEYIDDSIAISGRQRIDQFRTSRIDELDALRREKKVDYAAFAAVAISPNKLLSDRGNAEVAIAGTRLLLAIELFRAERGTLPVSLDGLVPQYLPELPQDQWASDGFRYRITDSGYLLYSVGADLIDDGGKPHPDNPLRAFQPSGKGSDYVLSQPRRPLADQLVFPDP